MRLGIIGGAGVLGSCGAYYAALNGLVSEIILYDIKKELAQNHAMDIDQGVCEFSETKVTVGSLDDLADCKIILNTVGVPDTNALTRDAYLKDNLKICSEISEHIKSWNTGPIIINATNPIDVLNYSLFKMCGGGRAHFIGYSKNDTIRFKWSISIETGIPASNIYALTIGEHGEKQVPLFSTVRRKDTGEPLRFSLEQRQIIRRRIDEWFGRMMALGVGRTMGWTSGAGMGQMVEVMLAESDEVFPCSVIPNGEYGLHGLSIGLPVRLGMDGVKEIVELPLEPEEKEGLLKAAEKIKSLTDPL